MFISIRSWHLQVAVNWVKPDAGEAMHSFMHFLPVAGKVILTGCWRVNAFFRAFVLLSLVFTLLPMSYPWGGRVARCVVSDDAVVSQLLRTLLLRSFQPTAAPAHWTSPPAQWRWTSPVRKYSVKYSYPHPSLLPFSVLCRDWYKSV